MKKHLVIFVLLLCIGCFFGTNVFADLSFPQEDMLAEATNNTDSFNADYPYLGTQKVLVVLVEFYNQALTTTEQQWEQRVFDRTAGAKTVANYWDEVSKDNCNNAKGKIQIVPAEEHYGTANNGVVKIFVNNSYQECVDNPSLILQAVIAKGYVNFYNFNTHNTEDMRITSDELHIVFVLAGNTKGNAPGNWIHPHKSEFSSDFTMGPYTFENYVIMGEKEGNYQAAIGTICHELGHSMGLPDLYDTQYKNALKGVGPYSLMGDCDTKVGNEPKGTTPVHLDAYCKIKLGIIEPVVVNMNQETNINVYPFSQGSDYNIVRINLRPQEEYENPDELQREKEYFLIENRQFYGYDMGMKYRVQNGGLAIWHINENFEQNGNASSRLVDLEEISESWGNGSQLDNGDTYLNSLYTAGEFNNNTIPSSRFYHGTPSWFKLSISSPSNNYIKVQIAKQNFAYETSKLSDFTCVGDFDGNGETEIAAIYKDSYHSAIVAWNGVHDETRRTVHTLWVGSPYDGRTVFDVNNIQSNLLAGDFNHDGYDDIAAFFKDVRAYDPEQIALGIWLGNAGGKLQYMGTVLGSNEIDLTKVQNRIVCGDFNGNGYKDDLAIFCDEVNKPTCIKLWNLYKHPVWDVIRYNEVASWEDNCKLLDIIPQTLTNGDFNGDGYDDIAAVYGTDSTQLYQWYNINGTSFSKTVSQNFDIYPSDLSNKIIAGDFNSDGKYDIMAFFINADCEFTIYEWQGTANGLTYGSNSTFNMEFLNINLSEVDRIVAGEFIDTSDISSKEDIMFFFMQDDGLTTIPAVRRGNQWLLLTPNPNY